MRRCNNSDEAIKMGDGTEDFGFKAGGSLGFIGFMGFRVESLGFRS